MDEIKDLLNTIIDKISSLEARVDSLESKIDGFEARIVEFEANVTEKIELMSAQFRRDMDVRQIRFSTTVTQCLEAINEPFQELALFQKTSERKLSQRITKLEQHIA